MAETRHFTCIICPMGCDLDIAISDEQIQVSGNSCIRGEKYAIQELTKPMRSICSTVRVDNGFLALLPVKSNGLIDKSKIFDVMKEINKVRVDAPIVIGQVIIEDVLGTGVDIIASKSMKAK